MISLEQLLVLVGIASASEVPVETFNVTEEYNLQENTQLYYINPDELTCLADNIYFEARNQGTAGWQAVAAVTLNRVKTQGFLILCVRLLNKALQESRGKTMVLIIL